MWVSFLVIFSSLLLIDPSTSCCCIWDNQIFVAREGGHCGCNLLGCNCATYKGWCLRRDRGVDGKLWCVRPWNGWDGKGRQEYCPARRRMKRSVATTISQVYGELYDHLVDRHEMEHFLRFDLNRDGLVSFEEANNSINATIEEFAEIDTNKDGFVHPAEFDESLI